MVVDVPSGLGLKPPYEILTFSPLVLPWSRRVGDAMDYSNEVVFFVPREMSLAPTILSLSSGFTFQEVAVINWVLAGV
jgi:hypothetical protein